MRVKTEAKREAIITAATGLFKKMGYERATMNELATLCGGSKATLYSYFSSKEELFVAVVQASSMGHLSASIKELSLATDKNESIEVALIRCAEKILSALTNDDYDLDAVYRMVVAEAGRSEVGQLFYESGPSQSLAVLSVMMDNAIKSGQLRDADSNVLALQFLGLVTAETDMRIYQKNPKALTVTQVKQMANRAVDMFLAGAKPK